MVDGCLNVMASLNMLGRALPPPMDLLPIWLVAMP